MKIWEVGVSDCENSSTICICATKELALKKMFQKRDLLIAEYKRMDEYTQKTIAEYCEKRKIPVFPDDSYKQMIHNLSKDDWGNWNNYPHETPWIRETEILEDSQP